MNDAIVNIEMSGTAEVEAFLSEIGLESCIQAVVHNGFYTSMEALRGAQYEELVDSGVRPVHAKLIISNLGTKQDYAGEFRVPATDGGDEVGTFLRSVGLEHCSTQLAAAGLTSLELLGEASMQDLVSVAGLKQVHARLIISNLDSASTSGISVTPANHRLASLDAEEQGGLLGVSNNKPRPRGRRLFIYGSVLLCLIAVIAYSMGGGSSAPRPSPHAKEPKPGKHAGLGTEGKHAGLGGDGKHGGGGKHHGGGQPAVSADSPHGKKSDEDSPHGKKSDADSPLGKKSDADSPHGKKGGADSPHGGKKGGADSSLGKKGGKKVDADSPLP